MKGVYPRLGTQRYSEVPGIRPRFEERTPKLARPTLRDPVHRVACWEL